MRVGTIAVSGLFVALATVSILSGKQTLGALAIAVITLASTVMLWLRHRIDIQFMLGHYGLLLWEWEWLW